MNTEAEMAKIFYEAFELFKERNAKYKDLWLDGGAEDNAFHLRHKAMRVFRTFQDSIGELTDGEVLWSEVEKQLTEDAMDLINYAAFYVICVQRARYRCKEEDPTPVKEWGLSPDDD